MTRPARLPWRRLWRRVEGEALRHSRETAAMSVVEVEEWAYTKRLVARIVEEERRRVRR